MAKPGIVLGGVHVERAIHDPEFFRLMPEFSSIRAQIAAMHIDINSKKGCSACNKRRLHMNIDGNFAAIASRLPDERAKTLKKYFGIDDDQKFFIRTVNPSTKAVVLKSF